MAAHARNLGRTTGRSGGGQLGIHVKARSNGAVLPAPRPFSRAELLVYFDLNMDEVTLVRGVMSNRLAAETS